MGAAMPHEVLPDDHGQCFWSGDASFTSVHFGGSPASRSGAPGRLLGTCAGLGSAALPTLLPPSQTRSECASSFLGLPGRLRRGPLPPLLLIRDRDPKGLCFDGDNHGIRFDDNEGSQPKDGEKEFVIDASVADMKSEGDRLFYRLSKRLDAKDLRDGRYRGARWSDNITGKDLGDGWVQVGERFLPKRLTGGPLLIPRGARVLNKAIVIWEDTLRCGLGNSRIIYAGGKSPESGMTNQPEAERGMEQLHTYHAQVNLRLADSKGYQEAAASSGCAPTPAGQRGASGPVVTWQVANQGVGGQCAAQA